MSLPQGRLRAQEVQEDMGASFSWRTELLQVLSYWEVLFIFKWNNQGGDWKLLLLVLLFEDRTAVTNSGSEKMLHARPLTYLLSKGDPGAAHPDASGGEGGEIFRQPAKLDFRHRACPEPVATLPKSSAFSWPPRITPSRHRAHHTLGPQPGRTGARLLWGAGPGSVWAGDISKPNILTKAFLPLKNTVQKPSLYFVLLPQIYTFIHLIKNVQKTDCISHQHAET